MKRSLLILFALLFTSSFIFSQNKKNEAPLITDVNIYSKTSAYELAKAVKNQNTSKIKKIYETNPEYFYIEDPYYDLTVVHWAVGMEKYYSLKCMLELGVNPNVKSSETDMTPIYVAAGVPFQNSLFGETTKYVSLLLKYNADPDIPIKKVSLPVARTKNGKDVNPYLIIYSENSPLMAASSEKKIKMLIEEGDADVNYRKSNGTSLLSLSLLNRDLDLAYYLLLDCKATITQKEIDAFNRISIKEHSKNYSKYLIIKELFKQSSLINK